MNIRELSRRIRLGEDSTLELKRVVLAGERVSDPKRNDMADELAALANARGGTVILGADDRSREVLGIALRDLDAVERWAREICNDSVKPALEDPAAPLWIDGYSTYKGRNDQIPFAAIASVTDSLRLIRIDRLQLVVCRPGEAFGNNKRRVQGRFRHAETGYALWVTDPRYERKYLSKLDGTYELGECCITVSLSEPYQDSCYKLIATIIEVV